MDSQRISEEYPQFVHDIMDSNPVDEPVLIQPRICAFCRQVPVDDGDAISDLETVNICGDCTFLFLEDIGSPVRDFNHRTTPRGVSTRHSSSEPPENLFSQQFTHTINMVRQNQISIPSHDDQYMVDANVTPSSSQTTPNHSRRWRQEIDGLSSFDSLFGESESNLSFGPYRHSHVDSDAISARTYGGESDASVDGRSFLDTDMFVFPAEGTELDSDTDIDPMRAGISHWDSSSEENEDGELLEADTEQDELELESTEPRPRVQNFLRSTENEDLFPRQTVMDRLISEQGFIPGIEESDMLFYVRDLSHYLDSRIYRQHFQHDREPASSRSGAPPTAVSFMKNLRRLVICEEHLKNDSLSCAICKDLLLVGVEVNQLPCLHLYHPPCILPWLSTRNSCPLCRYELPTDDQDYEKRKQNISNTSEIHGLDDQEVSPESSDELHEVGEDAEVETSQDEEQSGSVGINSVMNNRSDRRGGRRRLIVAVAAAAAAPIFSLVGIALVLWLSNPMRNRRLSRGRSVVSSNQRAIRSRRWWSFF